MTCIGNNAFYDCANLISVTFENTLGWMVIDEPVDVTDPAQNAVNLKSLHNWGYLERNE